MNKPPHFAKGVWILVFTVVCASITAAEPPGSGFYDRYGFLAAPPAAYGDGLVGFANPATLSFLHRPEMRFHWSSTPRRVTGFNDWGVFAGVPHLGLGIQRRHLDDLQVTDYHLALGLGSRAGGVGLAYGWSRGDYAAWGPKRQLVAATILRPGRRLSLGFAGHFSLEDDAHEWTAEVGLRPLRSSALTLFGDFAWPKELAFEELPWSAGAAVRLWPGVDLVGRYFDSRAFTIGLTCNLGRTGMATQGHFDRDSEYARQTYGLRLGGLRSGLSTSRLMRRRYYTPLEVRGRVGYLKYRLFDDATRRLYDVLDEISACTADPRVDAIALNLSGALVAPEHAWEIRAALKQARDAGKCVVVFVDDADMTRYHLASVADHLVMDPQGTLTLPGYALDRTYFRGTLGKLGLAFDEWRFYAYKSAVEVLSRDAMSDADREQNQAYVDDWYEQTRSDVCADRSISIAEFDRLVDEQTIFSAGGALAGHLVDTLARWSDRDRVVSALRGRPLDHLARQDLLRFALCPEEWGAPRRIALVYAIGVCALDTGIRARWLERTLIGLGRDPAVAAVVLRVDSPGGYGMASDLVAGAIEKCRRAKPVIVSQGQVAASGGYWISMNAEKIVAGPTTVTGSIGVIGGWIYDAGLGQKLGMSSDHVVRGAHGDFATGIRLPVVNQRIPARNLTAEERDKVEAAIREHYATFVSKVARGRGMPADEVERIAQGRFYSGLDGRTNGLVDELGNLLFALDLARDRAGITASESVEIVEYPRARGLFRWPGPSQLPVSHPGTDPVMEALKVLLDAQGRPLPLLTPGQYPGLD